MRKLIKSKADSLKRLVRSVSLQPGKQGRREERHWLITSEVIPYRSHHIIKMKVL